VRFTRAPKDDPEINLIPMIDVLLVIIIFLMLTTTYARQAELKINLPSASGEKKLERANQIDVMVAANGQYLIQGKPAVARDVVALAAELRQVAAGLKEPIVVISGDSNASYQSAIRIMDAARQAGIGQVVFAVEQPPK
jgi:biopolymer transport protein ExbD